MPARNALCLAVFAAACHAPCPSGTTLRGAPPPEGSQLQCVERGSSSAARHAPTPALGVPPSADGQKFRGPVTTWTDSGALHSHGDFAVDGRGTSLPDGLWTFWYPNGKLHSRAQYAAGRAVGCISTWDEDGTHRTHRAPSQRPGEDTNSSDLTPPSTQMCKGPSRAGVSELVSSLRDARSDTVRFDISAQATFLGGGFGTSNDAFAESDPALGANAEVAIRRHLRLLRLGARLSARTASDADYGSLVIAATAAFPLPKPHQHIDLEAEVGFGGHLVAASPSLSDGHKSLQATYLANPYLSADLVGIIPISKSFSLLLSTRLETGHFANTERASTLQRGREQPINVPANWDYGRPELSAGLGVRISLY